MWPLKIKAVSHLGKFNLYFSFNNIFPDKYNSKIDSVYKKEHLYKLNKPKNM